MQWKTVAIIGVGLIGGSIGLALKERRLARRVVGIGRRRSALSQARRLGAVDSTTLSPHRGVAEAELTVVCTPVPQIAGYVRTAAEHAPPGALITDAGSTKAQIVEAVDGRLPQRTVFIGSHPVAGSEKQGVVYARPDLFENAVCVLTPTRHTPADAVDQLREFWQSLGARVAIMSPQAHDRALAYASHLPHVVAAALAATLPPRYRKVAASGFRDTTRIAAGDPELWTGIFAQNREATLEALAQLQRYLDRFRDALEQTSAKKLHQLLREAKRRRDALNHDALGS